jgi:hypothetical protein
MIPKDLGRARNGHFTGIAVITDVVGDVEEVDGMRRELGKEKE